DLSRKVTSLHHPLKFDKIFRVPILYFMYLSEYYYIMGEVKTMKTKLSFSSNVAFGGMLFALFVGAVNLIFPAELGQASWTSLLPAIIGFLITGTGLPLLGVLAIAYSGSKNLQELATRVNPIYAIFFTSLLYLTIGPFFAAPRT